MLAPVQGPPADGGGAVRRRALRALVVRRAGVAGLPLPQAALRPAARQADHARGILRAPRRQPGLHTLRVILGAQRDRKSTRLNSSHVRISYAVFCLKKKKN